MKNINLYLLRVGSDTADGFHSPIFPDMTYLFVPISTDVVSEKTYSDYKWNGKQVIDYIPPFINKKPPSKVYVHDDPEFNTFTYGAPKYTGTKKGKILERNYAKTSNLNTGDIIAFYAHFENPNFKYRYLKGLYCFAYLTVQTVVEYHDSSLLNIEDKKLVERNYHFIHEPHDQIIIVGDIQKSRILEKAVLISSAVENKIGTNYYLNQVMVQLLCGYNKALNKSSMRKIDSTGVALHFKEYLDVNGK
jgi:Nucleotide modification associated domain 3